MKKVQHKRSEMQIRKIYKRCLNIKLEALTLKFEFGFNMMG